MSKIKLKSEDDILTFLKILAEESVLEAQKYLDPKQEYFINMMKSDTSVYGGLNEVEAGEDSPEDIEVEAEEEIDVEEPVSDEPLDVEELEAETPEEHLEVSLDSITDSIKQLRSGRSVDDSQIKMQIRTYYDRLSEIERQALLTFLKSFSRILTGAFDGSEAPDPSEPPSNITMSLGGSGEASDVEAEEEVLDEPEGIDVEEEEEEEIEDTSPPIRAGAPAAMAEMRERVRNLMNL